MQMTIRIRQWSQAIVFLFVILGLGCTSAPTREDAKVTDAKVDAALAHLQQEVSGASDILRSAKGVLAFPGVLEGAFWGGAEYGEGALRIRGRTADYYNIAAASFGFQFGAQKKDIILAFMDNNALQDFRKNPGWRAGIDGTVTLVTVGAEGSINSGTYNKPILAFVVDQKGLMAGISLEGSKITKQESTVARHCKANQTVC